LHVRHESCGECLEEGCDHGVEAGEVCAEAGAERKQAGEERDDGEKESDQVEGEHEATEVVVLVCADELLRHIVVGAEVRRRVEGQSWDSVTAIHVVAVVCAADREEGPSRGIADGVAAA